MYDFNELRRTVRDRCKNRVTFKRAAFLQRIIDKEKWSVREVLKMTRGNITWIPCTKNRNFISDALTFNLSVDKNSGKDFEYIICVDKCKDRDVPTAIIFSRKNLKNNARRIRKMSKLKAFL